MTFNRGWGAALVLASCAFLASGSARAANSAHAIPGIAGRHVDRFGRTLQDMCPAQLRGPGEARCYGKFIVRDAPGAQSALPAGLGATDIASAYSVPSTSQSGGAVVALVDVYSYSTALTDLNTYRMQYGLAPLTSCSGLPTAGGGACLAVVNQTGGSTPPGADPTGGWPAEMALDMAMVSAGCPDCSIVLVQANTENNSDIDAAVDYAATIPGVVAISNSYGWPETGKGTPFGNGDASHYDHAGILILAASGDEDYDDQGESGTGPSFPASAPTVLGVGGTILSQSGSVWTETVWNDGIQRAGAEGGGSGCSTHFSRPSFQAGLSTATCDSKWRASVDLAAAADFDAGHEGGGILIYQSPTVGNRGGGGGGGWEQVVGTSAATPMVAGLFARLGVASQVGSQLGFVYDNASAFHDIADGSTNDPTGACKNVMCVAGKGWDGPTGVGTPDGAALAALGMGTPVPTSGSSGGADGGSGLAADSGSEGGADSSSGGGSRNGGSDSSSGSDRDSGSHSDSGSIDGGSSSRSDGDSGNRSDGASPRRDGGDSSGDSSGGPGASVADVDASDDSSSPDEPTSHGCGCTTAGGWSRVRNGTTLVLGGLTLVVASRRRRRPVPTV
jgi:hypothetical protein